MRIKSNFKDYYDGLQAHGTEGLYIRHNSSEKIVFEDYKQFPLSHIRIHGAHTRIGMIGFCGYFYPYVYVNQFCYSLDQLDKQIDTLTDEQIEFYYGKPHHVWSNNLLFINRKEVEDKFTARKCEEPFFKYSAPILRAFSTSTSQEEYWVEKNCRLNQWDFQRVFGPVEAYRELSTYVNGVLPGQTKPIPVPDDDTMRDIKGFNEWSFRKPPRSK